MGVNNNPCSKFILAIITVWSVLTPLIIGDSTAQPSVPPHVIASHCSTKCGNVSIPYPFGIEDGCYYKEPNYTKTPSLCFKINCTTHHQNNTKNLPTIYGTNFEVVNISVAQGEFRTKLPVSYDCYNISGYVNSWVIWFNLVSFTLSSTKNMLVAIGCDTYATFSGVRGGKEYGTGCMTRCVGPEDVIDGECTGVGCCQASIPSGINNVTVNVDSFNNHSSVYSFNPCNVAFPVAKDVFRFNTKYLRDDMKHYQGLALPVVVNWSIGGRNCSVAKADGSCLCKENTDCYNSVHELGYRCYCKDGFSGNPYLPQGCSDINECEGANECEKAEYCRNTIGGHYCKCPKGSHGNGTTTDRCIPDTKPKPWLTPVLVTAGIGGGTVLFLVIGFILHWKHGKEHLKSIREIYFRENGGLLLHNKLSGQDVDILKVFSIQELEIATDNYNVENVIGRGGFGIVYKGILPNNQVVAIKKSLKVDPNQVEQFVNEVLVLSQINNKNVVKLLGCCLESEAPLLVYEFINNGTLYDHLNDAFKASIMKWHVRLNIASEVADVLSYLHNTISTPIIHRDMKSMNILIDERYTAKVSDFGASRLVPSDQDQLATMVLGTWGYLDPEYMQTSELTQKSDVYSFGVILLELLTRKKVISNDRPDSERGLAMHFILKMKEGRLLDILDKYIVNEGTIEEIQNVANLARWCLMLKGEERPTMKEVAMELETIKSKGSHPWSNGGSFQEGSCELLLGGLSRSDNGECSIGFDSNTFDSRMVPSLGGGR